MKKVSSAIDKIKEQKNILEENTDTIVPKNGIEEKLKLAYKEKRPLIVKLGLDPTAPDLHLGHAVVLKKMRQFQELGHKVVIIIGDFTGLIGDPSGKNKTRPQLSEEEVKENAKIYFKQLSKILDLKKIEVRYNSEWLSKLGMKEIIKLLAKYNLGRMISRDDFKNRLKAGTPIAMHELIYPLLQGYDSVAISSDVEMGGTDQLFNNTVGRFLQQTNGRNGQIVICMPILTGLDGEHKMSKSLGNYIGLTDEPKDMYGKVLSIPDKLLEEYLDLATSFSQKEKEKIRGELKKGKDPLKIKKQIALNIVEQYHGSKEAEEAEAFFYKQFQKKNPHQIDYQEIKVSSLKLSSKNISLVDILLSLEAGKSRGECKRLIKQGAVLVNDNKILSLDYKFPNLKEEVKIKIGKINFYKLKAS